MRKWLFIFACVHVVVWTLLPSLLLHNAPIDVIEGAAWGRQWAWGYDKHPSLTPWLTAFAHLLGGYAVWTIYLLSQISILICGFATWRLAARMLPAAHATLAVLLLEGIYYYHASAFEFNPNVLMLPLWAVTTLVFYHAIAANRIRTWLLLGFCAGLAMMTKYASILLLFSQLLFLIGHRTARRSFCHVGPYLALLVFSLVLAPHIIWLMDHQFISLKYALQQTSDHGALPHWAHRFFYPVRFGLNQLLVLTPVLLVFVPCFRGEKRTISLASFDRQFLYWFAIAPFVLTVLLSFLTGMRLRNQYGAPLFSLFGLLLVAWVGPRLTLEQFKKTLRNISIVFVLYMLIFTISAFTGYPRWTHAFRSNFPGPEIAKQLTEKWRAHYHRPLKFVAGNRWLSGNVAFYSSDHPTPYFDWDPKISFWIDEVKLQREGALFLWDIADEGTTPALLLARFPRVVIMPLRQFPTLGFAFLPPTS